MGLEVTKAKIIASAKKFLEDRDMVSKYLRGEADKSELDERGIKLALPIMNDTIKPSPESK